MSTQTVLFSGSAFDAARMQTLAEIHDDVAVRTKNVSPDIVGDLDFLLTGCRDREPVCLHGGDHFVVFQLDHELTEALGAMSEACIERVGDEWGIMDTSGTVELLGHLRHLAQTALARSQDVFLAF